MVDSEIRVKKLMKPRVPKGFSLVTVLSVGLIGTLWVTAAYALLLPLIQESSKGKKLLVSRTVAETAMDFVISDISQKHGTATPSIFDDRESGLPYNSFDLTPSQIGIDDPSNRDFQISVTVKNDIPPHKPENSLYDLQSVPNNEDKKTWSLIKDGWRIIEIKIKTGNDKRIYRSILKPASVSTGPSGTGSTYFLDGVTTFGTTSINLNQTNLKGDIVTNGSATAETPVPLKITGNGMTIEGNVSVNSLKVKSGDTVASAFDTSHSTVLKGTVTTNGDTSGFQKFGEPLGDNEIQIVNPNGGNGLFTQQESTQTPVAPAPSAPSNAIDLGTIDLAQNSQLLITNSIDYSGFDSPGTTIRIRPGNYKISSISLADNAKISIDPSVTEPTSFFIESAGTSSNAVNISSTNSINVSSQNGNASRFQIWYNGNKNITLNGKSSMQVYAPNSSISINSTSFNGALVGKNVSLNNSEVTLGNDAASKNNQYRFSKNADGSLHTNQLKRVSWQEFSYSEWIAQGNPSF